MKFRLHIFLLCFFYCYFIHAQKPIILTDSIATVNIGESASVFQDKTGKIPFGEIPQQTFVPNQGGSFSFSFSPDTFWFRFQISNQSKLNQNHWYFLWSDGLNNYVDIYLPQTNGSYQILKGGMLSNTSERAYQGLFPLYKIGLLPDSTVQTFYVRLKTENSLNGQLTLLTHEAVIDAIPNMSAVIWLVIGVQLLRVLYNIILARYIRNVAFRWYSFHTVIVTLSVLGSFGVTGNVLRHYPEWADFFNSIFYQLMPATYTLFVYALLNTPVNYPRLRWVFFFIVGSSFLQVPLHFLVPQVYLLVFHNYLFLFTEAFLSTICIYSLIKRLPMNKYLLIPCFFTLVPFAFLNLSALGYINYSWIYPMIYLTNFLEIFALSFVIGKVIEATEKEKIQSEKALLTEKLEAEKLAELDHVKTRFFTNISHEFRTPLTLLTGPLEAIRQKYPQEGLIPMMQRNVGRLQSLINQLLDLSKLEAGELKIEAQNGDIVQFFSYVFSSFESLAQSQNIHFNVTQNRRSLEAHFDADKLEKITTNLLSNAFKFTPVSGRITVDIQYSIPTLNGREKNNSSIENEGAWAIITVSDNGIGIDAQRLPRIFDRFYQVDDTAQRNYEGTGIGLALVKELVDILKGKITVSSQINQGTTFQVELPLKNPIREAPVYLPKTIPVAEIALMLPTKEISAVAKYHSIEDQPVVLIVEDNPDLRLYLISIFDSYYQILEAADGQQGLEIALKTVPDIVVTDLMMPRLDGFGLCKSLKTDERTSHIPVVLLTAKATLSDRLEGLELGADDYLQKPFNREELLVRVKNLLQQRALLRQKFSLIATLSSQEPSAIPDNIPQVLDTQFIQKVRRVVEAHLGESSFEIEDLCKELGMSRTNLHRKLKALTDSSATEFIRKIRLERAAQLLQEGKNSVSEVAYQVGFESLSYFSKTFQEQFGTLPSEYARKVN